MAVLVGIVIIGGIKKIAKVTDKIVPFMVVIYVAASLYVILANYTMIGDAFVQIFNGAFSPEGVAGGAVGVLVQGFKRAAFSNEAGVGSASIAHSAVKTKYAASEGMVALLEPFIDTVVVCTMTALVLIITGNVTSANAGLNDAQAILLTSGAFGSVISWFPYVLTIAVVLFAFSTMISWSYYGFQGWAYLFGRSKKMEYAYKIIFCAFVVIGSAASLGSVIGFSDAMIFAMLVPNMIGLFLLAPKVKEELNKYMAKIKSLKQ
jgi:AGCS family alanine or glycine:cation symporter